VSAATFRFPAVDGELWLGLRPLPIAVIALTVATAVGALYLGAPLPVGAALLIVGGIGGLWPAGSRPLVEWLPAAAGHLCAAATGAGRWVSPSRSLTGRQRETALRLPPEYGQLTLVSAHVADGMALLDDRRAGTVTVVLAVAGADRFALAGGAEQARLLTGWGQALTMLGADRALLRVQWVARAGPERRDPNGWMNARQPASVHLQPVPAAIAVRQARAARAKARLDAADRARLGMADSIAASQSETDGADQEAELVAGYTTHRIAALLTVTAPGPDLLQAACETVRAAAATARLDLRPLHGQHDLAFVAALPLCRPAAGRR